MLTLEMVKKLRSVGFSFPQFECRCLIGATYFYNGMEHTIGGAWEKSTFSETEKEIFRNGVWLPDAGDLLKWLELTGHSITINYRSEERYYYAEVENEAKQIFRGSGPDIECCLYKLIFKICRDSEKVPLPEEILILDIERGD